MAARRQSRPARAFGLATCLGTALVACIDLFHSTDFETLCEVDAAACAATDAFSAIPDVSMADAAVAFPANFCEWDASTARANALRACAWLGACAGPLGDNAFGPCVMNATLAYDCAANPNRPVLGSTHTFWDQLWRAQSCGDVVSALEPSKKIASCGASTFSYGACDRDDPSTRLACDEGEGGRPLGVEYCTALGQTCIPSGATAVCAGPAGCTGLGIGTACLGSQLQDCESDSGLDQGVNCASFGAGTCAAVGTLAACAALGDAGCPATSQITCAGDTAQGCPSGLEENVDCKAVLGVGGSCNASADGRPWDVARACNTGVPCPADLCSGNTLTACARGAVIPPLDCSSVGLGACVTVTLPGDAVAHAACAPPP